MQREALFIQRSSLWAFLRISSAVFIALALVVFPGCRAPLLKSPAEILKNSSKAQSALKSFKVRIRAYVTVSEIPGGEEIKRRLITGEGKYRSPDRSMISFVADSSKVIVITVGRKSFVKTSNNAAWMEKTSPWGSTTDLRDISKYLKATKGMRIVKAESGCYQLKYRVDTSKIGVDFPFSGSAARAGVRTMAQVNLWIEMKGFRVKKVTVSFKGKAPDLPRGHLSSFLQFEFYDFNKPLSIETPL